MKTKCQHTVTIGREGKTGSWCEACGRKIYAVDPRECKDCAHFRDVGWLLSPRPICTKHLMGVTRTMHVNYKTTEGTCFKTP